MTEGSRRRGLRSRLRLVARRLRRGAGEVSEVDFRARLGVALSAAGSELAATRRAERAPDFRDRLGVALSAAATTLLDERAVVVALRAPGEDFRDRLGQALTVAAGELAGERARSPGRASRARRHRRWTARLGRPVIVVTVLLCMAGGATASSLWLVQVGNPAYRYNPLLTVSPPPPAQLAALAVLRRPQSAADRGPGVQAALADVNQFTTGVRTNYVRVLESTANGPVVLVPVERRNATSASAEGIAQPAIVNALCVYYSESNGGPSLPRCWSTEQLLDDQAFTGNANHVFGLVPDGVSSVTVTLGATGTKAAVYGNFFDAKIAAGASPRGATLPAAPPIPSVTVSRSSG